MPQFVMQAGAVLLLAGAALQAVRWTAAPWMYTAGAVMFAWTQVTAGRYDGKNIVVKRLRRQQILGAMALVFTGVLMLVLRHNEWMASLSIAAVLELYTAFRIPQELDREKSRKSH